TERKPLGSRGSERGTSPTDSFRTSFPFAASHSRSVPSQAVVARVRPSGLKATPQTRPRWPAWGPRSEAVWTSQRLLCEQSGRVPVTLPSGEQARARVGSAWGQRRGTTAKVPRSSTRTVRSLPPTARDLPSGETASRPPWKPVASATLFTFPVARSQVDVP